MDRLLMASIAARKTIGVYEQTVTRLAGDIADIIHASFGTIVVDGVIAYVITRDSGYCYIFKYTAKRLIQMFMDGQPTLFIDCIPLNGKTRDCTDNTGKRDAGQRLCSVLAKFQCARNLSRLTASKLPLSADPSSVLQ